MTAFSVRRTVSELRKLDGQDPDKFDSTDGGAGAAWTLVFLAPFIAEVLSGATRVSYIFVFIPEVLTWGCGALIIREVVRRWRGGWPSLLMLGMGLSIACEFFI